MLKELFLSVAGQFSNDTGLLESLWKEIESNYSGAKRHYHNLKHLENCFNELNEVKPIIKKWDAIIFAVFYHDIIYRAHRKDNEEQSALFAVKCLKQLSCDVSVIEQTSKLILATKSHQLSDDMDVNFFTDADLSILGYDREVYNHYCNMVRKEYYIYPDLLYKAGRKKVLQHFLTQDTVFKTAHFYNKYEISAKNNIKHEMHLL